MTVTRVASLHRTARRVESNMVSFCLTHLQSLAVTSLAVTCSHTCSHLQSQHSLQSLQPLNTWDPGRVRKELERDDVGVRIDELEHSGVSYVQWCLICVVPRMDAHSVRRKFFEGVSVVPKRKVVQASVAIEVGQQDVTVLGHMCPIICATTSRTKRTTTTTTTSTWGSSAPIAASPIRATANAALEHQRGDRDFCGFCEFCEL
jgi:hypothetical protein